MLRKVASLGVEPARRLMARSVTAAWRRARACSWGLGDGLAVAGAELFSAGTVSCIAERGAVTVGGAAPAGARAANASPEVSWPPNVLLETDCALCIASCL